LANSSITAILLFSTASLLSIRLKIDARDPIVNEKNQTPKIIRMIASIISRLVFPVISPYPTVDMVVKVQYRLSMYSWSSLSSRYPP
jgi:hypothetical protein